MVLCPLKQACHGGYFVCLFVPGYVHFADRTVSCFFQDSAAGRHLGTNMVKYALCKIIQCSMKSSD